MSDELAAEHSVRYSLDNGEGLDVDDVARLLADYERRGTALRFLDEKYNIRREQQQRQDARVTKLSADLARALPVVAAAEALAAHESKHWAIDGDDAAEQARLVLAVGTAVRKAKGGER